MKQIISKFWENSKNVCSFFLLTEYKKIMLKDCKVLFSYRLDVALEPGLDPGGVGVGRILTAPGIVSGRMLPE